LGALRNSEKPLLPKRWAKSKVVGPSKSTIASSKVRKLPEIHFLFYKLFGHAVFIVKVGLVRIEQTVAADDPRDDLGGLWPCWQRQCRR
jgi:hypothetical protein